MPIHFYHFNDQIYRKRRKMIMTEAVKAAVAQEAVKAAVENAALEVGQAAVTTAKAGIMESIGSAISSNKKLIMWTLFFATAAGVGYYVYTEHQKKVAEIAKPVENVETVDEEPKKETKK